MYKHFVIYNVLLFTFIHGSTVPAPKVSEVDKNLPPLEASITKQAISEGGSIVSDPITLSNKTNVLLLNSVNDLLTSKEKPVQPRKGVDYNSTEDTNQQEKLNQTSIVTNNVTVSSSTATLPQSNITHQINANNGTENSNITKIHKPLILSHEALEKMDKLNMISPIDDKGPEIVNTVKAHSHPGMIMPIVITILVVPMFAVVGYMALKRGKEAWKNRHYKRMDFLLDGMYND